MIKFEHAEIVGLEAAIRGMRNPFDSWEKSDSFWCKEGDDGTCLNCPYYTGDLFNNKCPCMDYDDYFIVGQNDHDLMMRLRKAGTDHRKFMRMIVVYVDITAPLYW